MCAKAWVESFWLNIARSWSIACPTVLLEFIQWQVFNSIYKDLHFNLPCIVTYHTLRGVLRCTILDALKLAQKQSENNTYTQKNICFL